MVYQFTTEFTTIKSQEIALQNSSQSINFKSNIKHHYNIAKQ